MTNPALPLGFTSTAPGWQHILRHIAGLGGWVWADFFDLDGNGLFRDELAALDYIELSGDGRAYELTDAGQAWCRQHEESR